MREVDDYIRARKAIILAAQGRRGVSGRIDPCPICGIGPLAFAVASGNGHIRAQCETDNCVSFME
jgi:hypothetical protein